MRKKITSLGDCAKYDAKLGDIIDVKPESNKTKKSKSSKKKKNKTGKKSKSKKKKEDK